jgi:hypothetical protein
MIMKNILYLMLCLFVGCTGNEKPSSQDGLEQIDIFSECTDYDNNLSAVASAVAVIPLDNEPPINDFHTFDIRITDGYVFLSSIYHISQYDKNGNYIRNIGKRGMGPEEYVQLAPSIQIDEEKRLIYALDGERRRFCIYNFDGDFVRAIPYKLESRAFTLIDSTSIALLPTLSERFVPNTSTISFIDYEAKMTRTYYSHIYPIEKPVGRRMSLGGDNLLWEHYGNRFYTLEYGSDTIFCVLGDSIIPAKVLTGKLKPDMQTRYSASLGKKLAIMSYVMRENAGIFESDNFMIFKLTSAYESFYQVYNKKTKQIRRTHYPKVEPNQSGLKKQEYFTDDLVTGLRFNPQYQSKGTAIALIPAAEIVENKTEVLRFLSTHPSPEADKLKPVIERMQEEDNSLLMLVTFN